MCVATKWRQAGAAAIEGGRSHQICLAISIEVGQLQGCPKMIMLCIGIAAHGSGGHPREFACCDGPEFCQVQILGSFQP